MLKYRREKLTLVFDLCIFGAITLQLLAFILARCLPVSSESMYGIYTAGKDMRVILVFAGSFYQLKYHFSTKGRYLNAEGNYEVCPYCGANVQGKEQACRIAERICMEKASDTNQKDRRGCP